MDSRPVQTHAHEYDQHHNQPHNLSLQQVAHDTEEHQHDHEKKSVLKKVKEKAKKIKDTITKHGHHDNEHGHYEGQHIPDDHDLDEEDDDDEEEMVEDPEIHGAPIYDSVAVKSGTHAQNLGKPGVNFGGTSVMGVEPPHQPKVVVVSTTTETDQSRVIDPARTFVGVGEGTGAHHHDKVNLERPMGLEEDPHAPRTRLDTHTHAPANYETKVTDPTGAGGAEIDITPVQNSFARMNVYNEPKPDLGPKILPPVAETQYPPSVGGYHQFEPELSSATKTQFPQAETYDQHFPQLSSEIKTHYPRSHDMSGLSSGTRPTQYPSAISHDLNLPQISSATNTQYPSAISHNQNLPQISSATNTQYPSAISHNLNLPQISSATNTEYPSAIGHDQNLPQMSRATRTTPYPAAGSHDQFMPELSTDPGALYPPAKKFDQKFQEQSKTKYPSAGSHDQFSPDPIPTSTNRYEENSLPIGETFNTNTTTVGEQPQPHYASMENPSNQSSYTDKISSATSAIADKAVTAKNMVASKLGYGEQQEGDRDQNETTSYNEETRSSEKPSNQSSYISSATSAIADKAVSAKNTVASKLGYGEQEGDKNQNETTGYHEDARGGEKPSNQSSYISSATSAVADKAVSAKNTVASKLGYGEKGETNSNVAPKIAAHEGRKEENASSTTMSSSPTEYGKKIAQSLTEKLAPVYGKVAGVGSAVKSKVPGTVGAGTETDKGVSVKDYFAEKLRPGDEDRALSEVISETLHKRNNEEDTNVAHGEADRDMKNVVSDAMHKRGGEEHEGARNRNMNRPLMGKVTESEEVKRRLGSDEVTEKRYEESYVNSPGTGVVDKLKGVVGSWFSKQDENQSSSQGQEVEQINQAAGERRVQESSN